MKKAIFGSVPLMVFLVFLVLKLTSVADWPWIWVVAPLWVPLSIVLIMAAGMFCLLVRKAKKGGMD